MQLHIDVNSLKSTLFLELLNVFKKDDMINDYRIIDDEMNEDDNIRDDLSNIGNTLKDAKSGLGYHTSKIVNIKDM